MSGSLTFWLGLMLSIPIAILVNLITPTIQRILERRSATARKKSEDAALRRFAVAGWYNDNPTALLAALLDRQLRVLFSTAQFISLQVLSCILVLLPSIRETPFPRAIAITFLITAVVAIVLSLVQLVSIMNVVRSSRRIYYSVAGRFNWVHPLIGEQKLHRILSSREGDLPNGADKGR